MALARDTVLVIDDNEAVRDALSLLLSEENLPVETCETAERFLSTYEPERFGCLVLDIRMPGMDGLELQEVLLDRKVRIPIIFITGHGDVPMSVRALKAGAVDFLEKPFDEDELLRRVREALALSAQWKLEADQKAAVAERFQELTLHERDMMQLVAAGCSNQEIALRLDLNHRTVEHDRERLMQKMNARSDVELADMARLCAME
ncbi:MAG: response regulator transcription factor [Gammaproteobacteria bacterium]